MPIRHVSPSVNVIEIDNSGYTVPPTKTILALVGEATKGPINTPTAIADKNNLEAIFGSYGGLSAPYALFAARNYLDFSGGLYFIRSAYDATVQFTGTVKHPFTIASANKLLIASNNETTGTTVTIPAMTGVTDVVAASRITIALNTAGVSAIATANASNKIDLVATNDIFSMSLQAVANDAYDIFGWATTSKTIERAWKARENLTFTEAPVLETGNLSNVSYISGAASTLNNSIEIDENGSGNYVLYTIPTDFNGKNIASKVTDLAAAWNTTKSLQADEPSYRFSALASSISLVGSSLVTQSITMRAVGYSYLYSSLAGDFGPTEIGSGQSVVLSQTVNAAGTVYALTEGTDGNNLKVVYSVNTYSENQLDVTYTVNGKVKGTETLAGWNFDETDPDNYIENFVANNSNYITVDWLINNADGLDALTYTLSDGKNGINETMTTERIAALEETDIANTELIDINLVSIPGESSTNGINSIINFCENTRADCMAIIDPPQDLTATEVNTWNNDAGFNSSYAALYWPWMSTTISNPSSTTVFFPPSAYMCSKYAYNDNISEPWFAPAGETRGKILAEEMQDNATIGNRDAMYGRAGNNVNPIVNFVGTGKVVWGQKTELRTATALDRVNVRRMVLYAEKGIATIAKPFIFEPAVPATWATFTARAEDFLAGIQKRYGLTDFKVVCDATTNTPDIIDQNKMVGKIFLKPVKAIEVIDLYFTITSTGGSFTE
jgi:hypothetical protein